MRVAIDVSPLAQTRAGTARYLKGLIHELERRDDVAVSTRSFGGNSRFSTLVRDGVWYPFLLGRDAASDVLHCPTYRGPLRSSVPLVVTVHDLAVLRHPEAFNRWTRTYSPRVVPAVLRAARRVIAVSQFTRRELVELLRVPDEKIRVVPNAVGDEFTRDGPAEGGDYVLAVGTLVARLYRGAACFAYPSLYEGFGIPVLEALACGVPVVTTRGAAMEEVADGAAVLVDARDPADIAAGIERAAAERDTLVQRGLERARAFQWDAVAAATVDVYREAAS